MDPDNTAECMLVFCFPHIKDEGSHHQVSLCSFQRATGQSSSYHLNTLNSVTGSDHVKYKRSHSACKSKIIKRVLLAVAQSWSLPGAPVSCD